MCHQALLQRSANSYYLRTRLLDPPKRLCLLSRSPPRNLGKWRKYPLLTAAGGEISPTSTPSCGVALRRGPVGEQTCLVGEGRVVPRGCFYKLEFLLVGALIIPALLFGVYVRAVRVLDFWKLLYGLGRHLV